MRVVPDLDERRRSLRSPEHGAQPTVPAESGPTAVGRAPKFSSPARDYRDSPIVAATLSRDPGGRVWRPFPDRPHWPGRQATPHACRVDPDVAAYEPMNRNGRLWREHSAPGRG